MRENILQKDNNILVVDDNPTNISLLVEMLKDGGYRNVWPASSGARALAVLQKHAIDVILLDIRMPDMDGYAVCKEIKSDTRTQNIPVIFISALSETFDKLEAFSIGGADYITKPFVEEEVLARIQTQLSLVKQQERLRRLAEIAFEGILIHLQEEIVEANQTLADMLGYQRQDLIGSSVSRIFSPSSKDLFLHHQRAGLDHPIELQMARQGGAFIPVDVRSRGIMWNGVVAQVVAVRDMSWRIFFTKERRTIDSALQGGTRLGDLVGKSDMMKKVFESILRFAASDAPVLISGETGTGKELTARTIAGMSDGYNKKFIPVNCASIPEHLFESLFFGHRKGAFTGADRDHRGYFEQAAGGTLFLDEVGELSLEMQAKLLRVLNDFTYTPVGGDRAQKADVRLVAATNRDLRKLLDQKRVRSDFFHRLYILSIELPPLRWHKEDIPVLIAHYLQKAAGPDSPAAEIPDEILERFYAYDWPGNVRELFNELRRFLATEAVSLSGRLPEEASESTGRQFVLQDDLPLEQALEAFEAHYIPLILSHHGDHKGKAAEILRIDRKTLYRKLKKLGLV